MSNLFNESFLLVTFFLSKNERSLDFTNNCHRLPVRGDISVLFVNTHIRDVDLGNKCFHSCDVAYNECYELCQGDGDCQFACSSDMGLCVSGWNWGRILMSPQVSVITVAISK